MNDKLNKKDNIINGYEKDLIQERELKRDLEK